MRQESGRVLIVSKQSIMMSAETCVCKAFFESRLVSARSGPVIVSKLSEDRALYGAILRTVLTSDSFDGLGVCFGADSAPEKEKLRYLFLFNS